MAIEALKFAIICARVSSEDPQQERLDDQLAECRKWAEEHGYRIVNDVVENGVSGGLPVEQRPQLWNAIEKLRSGQIQALIIRELDRLGRRLDTAALVEELSAFGDGVLFVREPRQDDPEAEIIQLGLGGVMARLERARIYRRTAQGKNRIAAEGKGTIGHLPSWLAWDDKRPLLVEAEADKVRAILQDYPRLGIEALALRYDIDKSRIRRLLSNPALAGRRYVHPLPAKPLSKTAQQRRRRKVMAEIALSSTIVEADAIAERHHLIMQEVPELISWERFHEIQTHLLEMGSAQRGRPPNQKLPLQGRVRCSVHGLAYTPRRTGNGFLYAECSVRRGRQAQKYGKCTLPRFPWLKDTSRNRSLLTLVREGLEKALETPAAIERGANDYIAALEARVDRLDREAGHADGEVEKLKTKLERVSLLWADGSISDEAFQEARRRVENQLTQAQTRILPMKECLRELASARQSLRLAETARPLGLRPGATFVNLNDENEFEEVIERLSVRIIIEPSRIRVEGVVPLGDVPLEVEEKSLKSS